MEFLQHLGPIIGLLILAVFSYFGFVAKKLYTRYIDTDIKKNVVNVCVEAVGQMYAELKGDEKLEKCCEMATTILREKGLDVSDTELRALIEAGVWVMNDTYFKTE